MDQEIRDLETQLRALQKEEQILTRQVESLRMERRKDLVEEIIKQRRSNEKLRAEIRSWEKASTERNDQQPRKAPKEATPPRGGSPSPPEESTTSPTKNGPLPKQQETEGILTPNTSPRRSDATSPQTAAKPKTPGASKLQKGSKGNESKKARAANTARGHHSPRRTRISWKATNISDNITSRANQDSCSRDSSPKSENDRRFGIR